MSTTHTPGPWKYRIWDYSKATPPRQELCIESESFRLAVLDSADAPDNPYTVPADEAEANARLIAAAPDLLAALRLALNHIEHGWTDPKVCISVANDIRNALANVDSAS